MTGLETGVSYVEKLLRHSTLGTKLHIELTFLGPRLDCTACIDEMVQAMTMHLFLGVYFYY